MVEETVAGVPRLVGAAEWVAYDVGVRRERTEGDGVAVALCHRDGRVRARTLRGEVPGELLPLVVLRAADWAEPVREAARRRLERTEPAALADVAHVLVRAGGWRRGSYGLGLLAEAVARDAGALWRVLRHPAREARRWGVRLAVDGGWLTADELAGIAVRDHDVRVHTWCAEAALGGTPVPEGALEPLLSARASGVRAVAVTALRRAGTPLRGAAFLDDRSAAVRSVAQWAVRTGGADPAAHYRRVLAAGGAPHGSVAGLGECGDGGATGAGDVALLVPYLRASRATVRAAAVGALAALGAASPARVGHLLGDTSSRVAGRVAQALVADADVLPLYGPDGLLTRVGTGRPAPERRAAFRLLAARNGLEPLRAALRLLDDPEVGHRARGLAGRWAAADAGALAAALPEEERALLAGEIDAAEEVLSAGTVRFLRWILRLREE